MSFLLLISFLLIRFGLLSLLGRGAVLRAAHYPPQFVENRTAYLTYQISTAAIFLSMPFLAVKTAPAFLFYGGLTVYIIGAALLAASMVHFAAPAEDGVNRNGLYRFSRNPMYVAYFVFFLGCVLLTQSPILLAAVLCFQTSGHWLILAEEEWCAEQFGEAYRAYMDQVRRYL